MQIAMIGTGYVGLVSAACFAEFGVDVTAVDSDHGKIERLQSGAMPIYEPGLEELVVRNTEAGRLTFTTDLASALEEIDAVFIAVGTPSRRGDGHADLTYLFAAAEQIAQGLKGDALVVTKSTVPVGTGRKLHAAVRQAAAGPRRSRSPPIRSSCARARRSRTSCGPTASWSASRASRRRRCSSACTGRST